MAGLQNAAINLGVTSRLLKRQSERAEKDAEKEKAKVKKALQKKQMDIANIYAGNASRKMNEQVQLLTLASKLDALKARVDTAVTMQKVTANMTSVVKSMDKAAASLDVGKISAVMDRFEDQFGNLDVATEYYGETVSNVTAVGQPQDAADRILQEAADEVGVEMQQDMEAQKAPTKVGPTQEQEDVLGERLRALRSV